MDQARALLGAGFLEDGAARHDDVAAAAVHLENLERLRQVHQRADVADRADVDLAAGQEGDGAAEIDGEAALDPAEDHALDAVAGGEFALELVPCGFAARAVARQHRFALADSRRGRHRPRPRRRPAVSAFWPGAANSRSGDPAFRLQAHIDHRHVVLDRGDGALDHLAFEGFVFAAEAFVEERREIVAGRKSRGRHRVGVFQVLIGPAAWRATVAGLHMRTWSNALPRPAHPMRGVRSDALHGKKRVPVPVQPVHRTRSPKDGLPRVLNGAPAGRCAP